MAIASDETGQVWVITRGVDGEVILFRHKDMVGLVASAGTITVERWNLPPLKLRDTIEELLSPLVEEEGT